MYKPPIFTPSPTVTETLDRIRAALPDFVGEKRLNHIFFVEKEVIALAESVFLVYNIADRYRNDLRAAALLHDLTKQKPLNEQLALCEKYGIAPGLHPSAAVLHGPTAAALSEELFGINRFVGDAIACHTTGKPGMNALDEILFVADYIEPSRTHLHCKQTRAHFYDSLAARGVSAAAEILDETALMSIDGTLSHLIDTDSFIDEQTVLTRNDLLARLRA